jgi:hypothetical protein
MKKLNLVLFMLLLSLICLKADEIRLENWKCYSSLLSPTSITTDWDGNIWAGTTGGAFSWNPTTEKIFEYRNISAMMSINVTTINCLADKKMIFVGQSQGWLDIYDETGNWTHITDIYRADNFPNKQISDIAFNGGKAYIVGGFGLAVFDIENKVFIENVVRLGKFQLNTEVNKVRLIDNKIWLATKEGIAVALLSSNLTNPDSWTNYSTNNGLVDKSVQDIIELNGEILAASGKVIYKIKGDSTEKFLQVADWEQVLNLANFNNTLAYSTQFNVIVNGIVLRNIPNNVLTKGLISGIKIIEVEGVERLAVLMKENGVQFFDFPSSEDAKAFKTILPNTPITNSFMDIKANKDGSVWIAADQFNVGIGKGFMRFDGTNWDIFTFEKYPELKGNNFFKIACAPDGKVYASNYGSGLFVVDKVNNKWQFKLFNEENSAFVPYEGTFVIPGETAFDSRGTSWTVNRGETSEGPILVGIDNAGKSYGYVNKSDPSARGVVSLAIDGYGTKWIGGNPGNGKGLIYYNDNDTPEDLTDDKTGILTYSEYDDLLSNEHSTIAYDYNRILWVGTPAGLVAIANLNFLFYNSKPIIRSVPILSGQPINDILIDPQNRKWLATTKGVWVIDENGNKVLAHITTENSPLSTDDVKAIELNEVTGEVYLGTQNGLFVANTLSIKPLDEYKISCYPQPFNLNKDTEIAIDGLGSVSEVRILTVSGALVKVFNTESRKFMWDGKDENGKEVAPGVYLIVTKSGDSAASGVGKIAIIRD